MEMSGSKCGCKCLMELFFWREFGFLSSPCLYLNGVFLLFFFSLSLKWKMIDLQSSKLPCHWSRNSEEDVLHTWTKAMHGEHAPLISEAPIVSHTPLQQALQPRFSKPTIPLSSMTSVWPPCASTDEQTFLEVSRLVWSATYFTVFPKTWNLHIFLLEEKSWKNYLLLSTNHIRPQNHPMISTRYNLQASPLFFLKLHHKRHLEHVQEWTLCNDILCNGSWTPYSFSY